MNGRRSDAELAALFDELAMAPAPDYLDAILQRTTRATQRTRLAALERILHLDPVTPRAVARERRALRVAVVALAILLAIVALAVAAGSRRVPPPFGVAGNGVIAYSVDGDIVGLDPISRATRVLVAGPDDESSPRFSRRGDRFAFIQDTSAGRRLFVADADGSDVRLVAGPYENIDGVEWSPDDTRLLVTAFESFTSIVDIVRVDGTGTRRIDLGMPIGNASWRPPDGSLILVRGEVPGEGPDLFVTDAEGHDPRRLHVQSERIVTDGSDVNLQGWSPDGAQLIYNAIMRSPTTGRIVTRNVLADVSADGRLTEQRTLEFDPTDDQEGWAVWSPSGDRFVMNVALMDATSAMWIAVARSDGIGGLTITGPSTTMLRANEHGWSPDGTVILARYWEENQAWLLDPDGGRGEQVSYWARSPDAPNWQRTAP
jgi:hypothetical protein